MIRISVLQAPLLIAIASIGAIQDAPPVKQGKSDSPANDSKNTTSPVVLAKWKLEWDDRLDGVLQEGPKACEVNLGIKDSRVNGMFAGPVLGKTREAAFVGDLVAGSDTQLLLMRQLEGTYVCAYQCQSMKDGSFVGVWHDNASRSGDVRLRRIALIEK